MGCTCITQRRNITLLVLSKDCNVGAEHLAVLMPMHTMQACGINECIFWLRDLVLTLSTLIVCVCHNKEALYMPTSCSYRQNRPRLQEGTYGM